MKTQPMKPIIIATLYGSTNKRHSRKKVNTSRQPSYFVRVKTQKFYLSEEAALDKAMFSARPAQDEVLLNAVVV